MHDSNRPAGPGPRSSPWVWREATEAEHPALQAFIAAGYAREHGARLLHFQPRLFGLWQDGVLQAALGVGRAGDHPLFLEHYLNMPAEQRLAEVLAAPIDRSRLIEVGNLAARRRGLLRPLIIHLIETLVAEGRQWLVFTATRQVRNAFLRLGLEAWPLAEADPARLGTERADWGRYYANAPLVMGGDMVRAWHHLQARRAAETAPLFSLSPHQRTCAHGDASLPGCAHV
ncbi:MAG: hypothetical protein AWU55_2893 [Halomonadaceae bacterium T82-2]|nr:MAG: hypothetical protein AWU55_2893 [Halomonadaceae bacterium T82-2]